MSKTRNKYDLSSPPRQFHCRWNVQNYFWIKKEIDKITLSAREHSRCHSAASCLLDTSPPSPWGPRDGSPPASWCSPSWWGPAWLRELTWQCLPPADEASRASSSWEERSWGPLPESTWSHGLEVSARTLVSPHWWEGVGRLGLDSSVGHLVRRSDVNVGFISPGLCSGHLFVAVLAAPRFAKLKEFIWSCSDWEQSSHLKKKRESATRSIRRTPDKAPSPMLRNRKNLSSLTDVSSSCVSWTEFSILTTSFSMCSKFNWRGKMERFSCRNEQLRNSIVCLTVWSCWLSNREDT